MGHGGIIRTLRRRRRRRRRRRIDQIYCKLVKHQKHQHQHHHHHHHNHNHSDRVCAGKFHPKKKKKNIDTCFTQSHNIQDEQSHFHQQDPTILNRIFFLGAFSCAIARCEDPDSAKYNRHSKQQSLTCSTWTRMINDSSTPCRNSLSLWANFHFLW